MYYVAHQLLFPPILLVLYNKKGKLVKVLFAPIKAPAHVIMCAFNVRNSSLHLPNGQWTWWYRKSFMQIGMNLFIIKCLPIGSWTKCLMPYSFNSLQWRHTQTQSAHLIIVRVAPLRWRVYPRDQSRISAGVRKSLIYAPMSLQWVKWIGYRQTVICIWFFFFLSTNSYDWNLETMKINKEEIRLLIWIQGLRILMNSMWN